MSRVQINACNELTAGAAASAERFAYRNVGACWHIGPDVWVCYSTPYLMLFRPSWAAMNLRDIGHGAPLCHLLLRPGLFKAHARRTWFHCKLAGMIRDHHTKNNLIFVSDAMSDKLRQPSCYMQFNLLGMFNDKLRQRVGPSCYMQSCCRQKASRHFQWDLHALHDDAPLFK